MEKLNIMLAALPIVEAVPPPQNETWNSGPESAAAVQACVGVEWKFDTWSEAAWWFWHELSYFCKANHVYTEMDSRDRVTKSPNVIECADHYQVKLTDGWGNIETMRWRCRGDAETYAALPENMGWWPTRDCIGHVIHRGPIDTTVNNLERSVGSHPDLLPARKRKNS